MLQKSKRRNWNPNNIREWEGKSPNAECLSSLSQRSSDSNQLNPFSPLESSHLSCNFSWQQGCPAAKKHTSAQGSTVLYGPWSRECGRRHGRLGFHPRTWRRRAQNPSRRRSRSPRSGAWRLATRRRLRAGWRRDRPRAAARRPPRAPHGSGPFCRRKGRAPGRAWRLRGAKTCGSKHRATWPVTSKALELRMKSAVILS